MIGIYKITNKINNKVYIGQSQDIKRRWKRHRNAYNNPSYPQYNCILYKAMRKYGLGNFIFEILEQCDIKELNYKESYYIDLYNSTNIDFGYNMVPYMEKTDNNSLNEEKIQEIRLLLLNTKKTQVEISNDFNVTQSTISSINNGRGIYYDKNFSFPLRPKKWKYNYCKECGVLIEYRSTHCIKCENKNRKHKRKNRCPVSREELKNLIRTTPFTKIGEKFGITDNAIRKWCKNYDLPFRSSDIKKYTDEEWKRV